MVFLHRFVWHPVLLTCMMLCVLLSMTGFASASFPDSVLTEIREEVSASSEAYSAIRAELELADPSTWTIEQIHAYLNAAIWVVYDGLTYYFMQNGSLPDDLEQLAGTTYIPVWPANPFNGWNPIHILATGDGFSPGDVVLQVCPPEFYSYIKNTRPVSCELAIFGPDVKYGNLSNAQPLKANTWAITPEGAVFMLGQYAEPASVALEKYKKLIENK